MNRILALVIAVSLICGSMIPAFASDYSGHWAESVAKELLAGGVISGDGNGLRLDDNIKRSEFIKVINNAFKISDGGMVNFPDVSVDKWYFNEFLKAKNAGYLTGDQNGNANPEANIKRVEAAVILTRVLGYMSEKTIPDFNDDSTIPDWGKDAVYTLASKKIINGYTDGSFKANANLTRAEAFTLVFNSGKSNTGESGKNTTSTNVESVSGILPSGSVTSGNGGSSGGGGGGGGGSSAPAQSLKITWTDEENNTVHWNQVSGAGLYTVTVTRKTPGVTTGTVSDTTSLSNYVLTDLVKRIAPVSDRQPVENVEVVVSTTVGGNVLTAATVLKVSYPHVKTPEMSIVSEDKNGEEVLSFVWEKDENADIYTFSANLDNTDFTTLSYREENGKCIAEIPDSVINSLTKTLAYKIEATVKDADVIPLRLYEAEINNLLYASGEGTDFNPYIIRYARHFRNISENPDAHYYLASDITLDQNASENSDNYYSLIENFTGNLTGYNLSEGKKEVRTITVNSTNGIGVFEKIENANIEKIRIAGTVTSTEKVLIASPFIGTITGTSSITDCENTAELSVNLHGSSDPGMGKAGGIAAYNAGVTSFVNCINSAALKVLNSSTASYLGGILGGNSGVTAEKPSFKNCGNTGDIDTESSCAAGIIAMPKSVTISSCYNVGNITSAGSSGGIVATTTSGAAVAISKSYNSGKINSAKAGGILGTAQGTSVIINESYNSGIISGTTAGKIVAESTATTNTITDCYDASSSTCGFASEKFALTNCYYLAANTQESVNGLKPLSEADMKNLSSFDFSNSVWMLNLSGAYKYPQIVDNLHKFIPETIEKPNLSVNLARNSSELIISGSSFATGYLVVIGGNEITVEGGGNKSVDITSYVASPGNYSITVKALGDGEAYKDSLFETIQFEKEAFMFIPTVTSVKGNEYDEYTVSWTINDREGLANYLITVTDKESGTDILYDELLDSSEESYVLTESIGFVPGNEYTFKIKAIGTNPDESTYNYITKDFTTLYAGGEGTEDSPYVIRNDRHFRNITAGTTEVFWLAEDIELNQTLAENAYVPVNTFNGKLIGMNSELSKEEIRTINIVSESGTGLFTTIVGATIRNIRLTGSVEGTGVLNVAAFAGESDGGKNVTSVFENCENAATVINNGPAVSYLMASGFVAVNGSAIRFTDCINSGKIWNKCRNAANTAAGFICSTPNTSGMKAEFTNCRNTAEIIGGLSASGFVGAAGDVIIDKSYNTGKISTEQYGAAFVCTTVSKCTGITVENSYNIGEITNNNNPRYDLVLGGFVSKTDRPVTVTNSYNAGVLTNTSGKSETISPIIASGTATTVNCYYLSDETGAESNGLTPLSSDDMKIKDNFAGFDFDTIWNEPAGSYPTLK